MSYDPDGGRTEAIFILRAGIFLVVAAIALFSPWRDWRIHLERGLSEADPWFFVLGLLLLFPLSSFIVFGSFPAESVAGAWLLLSRPGGHRDAPEARWVFLGIDDLCGELRRGLPHFSLRLPVARGVPARLGESVLFWDPRVPGRVVSSRFVPWRPGVCLSVGGAVAVLGTGEQGEHRVRASAARFEQLRDRTRPSSGSWIAMRSSLVGLGISIVALAPAFFLPDLAFTSAGGTWGLTLGLVVVVSLGVRVHRQATRGSLTDA